MGEIIAGLDPGRDRSPVGDIDHLDREEGAVPLRLEFERTRGGADRPYRLGDCYGPGDHADRVDRLARREAVIQGKAPAASKKSRPTRYAGDIGTRGGRGRRSDSH